MNDIKIKTSDEATWDIQFKNDDLDVLTGEDAVLQNGVILSLLTRNAELDPNNTYNEYGSRLYSLIKQNDSQLTRSRIRAYIKEAVEDMNRVKSVDDIIFMDDEIQVYITKEGGESVNIGLRGIR